ncbi:MAG: cytochrome c, partial [Burkholderiales bacterium]|nr:cytochrome c [Burkholderiales bacterium]
AERCADCHGEQGEGVPGMYPPLAGNRAILLEPPVNTIRAVLNGGFPPATAGNPQPFGMPPYATLLSDEDVAAVVSYIRNAWGNRASPVNAWEVATEGRGIGVR